jgi:hypothetical protein
MNAGDSRSYRPSEIESTWQARRAADRISEIDVERVARDRKMPEVELQGGDRRMADRISFPRRNVSG